MSRFISNVNQYLAEMKIKQSYLSRSTGIDKNKLSRLLTGVQEETGSDMEKIAKGLGKPVEYFVAGDILISKKKDEVKEDPSIYERSLSEKQKEIAAGLIEIMKNINEVMGAKDRFENIRWD